MIKPDYVMLRGRQGFAAEPTTRSRSSASRRSARTSTGSSQSVNAKLDSKAYREMSRKVFNDKEDPAAVVKTWLKDNGLT